MGLTTLNIGCTYNHESSLYTHFSSSQFVIDPYPKELKNPHTLYDLTSSNGTSWFNTIETAKAYDALNDTKLTEMIPLVCPMKRTKSMLSL